MNERSKPPLDTSSPSTSAFVLRHVPYFSCAGRLHTSCLPTNWIRTCTLVYSSPNILTAPNNQPLPIPLIHKWIKRAIHFIPLLVGLGILAGIGKGTAGLTTSIQTLSKDLSDSLQEIAQGRPNNYPKSTRFLSGRCYFTEQEIRPTQSREERSVPFSRRILLFLCQPVGDCPRNCKKPNR